MPLDPPGGGDVTPDEIKIERLLLRDVSDIDRDTFRAELAAAAPYETRPTMRARIHLSMLFLAKGDLHQLRRARKLADADWRDLFMQAEYPSTPGVGVKEELDVKKARELTDKNAVTEWQDRLD